LRHALDGLGQGLEAGGKPLDDGRYFDDKEVGRRGLTVGTSIGAELTI
jgi:hypothetical protein